METPSHDILLNQPVANDNDQKGLRYHYADLLGVLSAALKGTRPEIHPKSPRYMDLTRQSGPELEELLRESTRSDWEGDLTFFHALAAEIRRRGILR